MDQRFVAVPPPPLATDRAVPIAAPQMFPNPGPGQVQVRDAAAPGRSAVATAASVAGEPSCWLVTNDRELIDAMAMIALSCAVRLRHCPDPQQLPEMKVDGPVLWGADQCGWLGQHAPGTGQVLVGRDEHAQQLWLAASAWPQTRVAVLPQAAGWLGEYLGQWALRAGHGHTLALAALAGGIGTSSLACLSAHAGTLSGLESVVLDLDPHSGSLWPMLSWQPVSGIGWEQLRESRGHLAPHQFREMLPRCEGTAVLSWRQDPGTFVIDEPLAARVLVAARQAFDLVVIDTGRFIHPLAPVLGQFQDRMVLTGSGQSRQRATGYGYVLCAGTGRSPLGQPEGLLGFFPQHGGVQRCAERGELLQALRSRRLRQAIADCALLPLKESGS